MTFYTNNTLCNVFRLDSLLKENVGKFIYVSSVAVFGEADRMPITHQTVRCPMSPLGNAQLFVENMLESFKVSYGLTYAIVRASNVTGMSDVENEYFIQNLRDGLVLHIIKQFFGETDAVNIFGTSYDTIDFTAERDYLHVDDFCNACVNVLPKLLVRGEGVTYNLGSGKKYSVKEVIIITGQVFGV